MYRSFFIPVFVAGICAAAGALASDWPQWGGTDGRNMVSAETNLPETFFIGKIRDDETVDRSQAKNVKWVAKLGSQSYGSPVIANGRVFVGTNNEAPRDSRFKGDKGVLFCLDEKTGELIWQLIVPKLPQGKVNDWEYLGICSTPHVDGDRLYVVTNRCEVVCLDVNGLADGNDGPFRDEGQYFVGPGKSPVQTTSKDADILWRYDMRENLGVFPHNASTCSVVKVGENIYSVTSNGVDWSHTFVPSPFAPSLVGLNAKTGKLIGEDDANIGENIKHGTWSNPSVGVVGGKPQILFGGGDGVLYAIDPVPVAGDEQDDDGKTIMRLPILWKFDCVPPEYKRDEKGKRIKYPSYYGPSEIIATPVFHNNRVYVAIGQDPEHGEGLGALQCIDATKKGDITSSGAIWTRKDIKRSLSTVAIAGGLLFTADFTGFVYCLNADTGKLFWKYDTFSRIWGSPLIADGKVYIGNEEGKFYVFAASKEKKLLHSTKIGAPVYGTPVAANGVLYLTTQTHLFAIEKKD